MKPEDIKALLSQIVGDLLYLDIEELNEKKPFSQLGLDSILGMEFIKATNAALGIDLKASTLYDYPNLRELSAHLAQQEWNTTEQPAEGMPKKDTVEETETIQESFFRAIASEGSIQETGQVRFSYRVNIENNPCLRDHLIFGHHVLPTDAYVELAYSVFREQFKIDRLSLKEIILHAPLITASEESPELFFELKELSDGRLRFSIHSRSESAQELMLHLKGFVDLDGEGEEQMDSTFAEQEAVEQTLVPRELTDIYRKKGFGEFYSNPYTSLTFTKKGIVGTFELASSPSTYLARAMNAALVATMLHEGRNLSKEAQGSVEVIPYTIQEVALLGSQATGKYRLVARRKEGDRPDFDVEVIDEEENTLLYLRGLRLHAFSEEQLKAQLGKNSHNEHREATSKVTDKLADSSKDIAIVGMSGRFPGAANIGEYWKNLCEGVDAIQEIGEKHWNGYEWYHPDPNHEGTAYSKWGGFIADSDKFDPLFFGISPREAKIMDPQQRVFLEESWKTMENAGYSMEGLDRQRIGVFVGAGAGDYLQLLQKHKGAGRKSAFTGNSPAILASRISYYMNFTGPALALDTACSSSLVAIDRACQSLLSGESTMALAGGVCLMTTPLGHIWTSQTGMPSKEGRCKTFDDSADGIVSGEGVGVLLLKKREEAEKDGDRIYAVIKASGVNQDGRTNGITAPSMRSQAELQQRIYTDYAIDPGTITYVEAHGTGTKLGDPIEMEALTHSFGKYTDKKQYCAIGSVKTNIGHTAMASGVAGVIKTILMMQHRKYVPNLHFDTLNEQIDLENSPFYISTQLKDWNRPAEDIPRRAAVSSFGFGGTNAHMVLEEYTPEPKPTAAYGIPALILLSARNKERLRDYATLLSQFLVDQDDRSLHDIAYTLQAGREAMEERMAFRTDSIAHLREQLANYLSTDTAVHAGSVKKGRKRLEELKNSLGTNSTTVLVQKGEYEKVLDIWCHGGTVDWTVLYSNAARPAKISLPTYPFARERHWVTETASEVVRKAPTKTESKEKEKVRLQQKDENTIGNEMSGTQSKVQLIRMEESSIISETPSTTSNTTKTNLDMPHLEQPKSHTLSEVSQVLLQMLADILYIAPEQIDAEEKFINLGLDSVIGVELIQKINDTFLLELAATDLYNYPTLETLGSFIHEALPTTRSEYPAQDPEEILMAPMEPEPKSTAVPKSHTEAEVAQQLLEMLAGILYIAPEQIDLDEKFINLGLDSVIGVELIQKINDTFILELAATDLYNYPTLDQLSRFVYEALPAATISTVGQHQEVPNGHRQVTETTAPPALKVNVSVPRQPSESPKAISPAIEAKKKNTKGTVSPRDIAIVGLSTRMPGAADSHSFLENLKAGRNSIKEVPEEKWPESEYFDLDKAAEGKSYSKWMGVLEHSDKFDPLFFNISPKEARVMDPQQRVFLEQSWAAIEDAGYDPKKLSEQRCGVFVGVTASDYNTENGLDKEGLDSYSLISTNNSILSARISYFLNLKGPSVSIDTACSSSLVAVAQACDSLLLDNCDWALAGGVSVLSTPNLHILTSKAGMLSEDGQCHTFDESANGFVPAEGVGVVVLKRRDRAEADGDRIYGIIKGWGMNQDGATNGITAPSDKSQTQLQKGVYDKFDIDPGTISYVEAHGTGTKLGDPIEIKALKESFQAYTNKKEFCGIGSVKTNIGHALTAAGVSGLIKVLLSIQEKQLFPSLNFNTLNPHIPLKDSPFFINSDLRNWEVAPGQPRRAAINSFGFSGTNVHVVIEEHLPKERVDTAIVQGPQIMVISAKNCDRLLAQLHNLSAFLTENPSLDLADMAYTLQLGRSEMEERFACVIETREQLMTLLDNYLKGKKTGYFSGNAKSDDLNLPLKGAVGQAMIREAIANKELEVLAQLWVKGAKLDWEQFHTDHRPQKVGLPTYPFERKRYWIDRKRKTEPATVATTPSTLEARKSISRSSVPVIALADNRASQQKVQLETTEDGPKSTPTIEEIKIRLDHEPEQSTVSADSMEIMDGNSDNGSTENKLLLSEKEISEVLSQQLQDILYLDEKIAPKRKFIDYGMDSITGVEYVKLINTALNINISATDLYDHPTVSDLAKFISEKHHAVGKETAVNSETGNELTIALPEAAEAPPFNSTTALSAKAIADILSTQLQDILYLDEKVAQDRKFIDYGMDSITGVEYVKNINKALDLNLSATDLYDHPTVGQLTSFIAAMEARPSAKLPETQLRTQAATAQKVALSITSEDSQNKGYLVKTVQGIEETHLETIALPDPESGEVQIKVMASSVNFPDIMCVKGLYPTMPAYPFVPGFEVSGQVTKVGPDVTEFAEGDEVVAITGAQLGGHSSFVNVSVTTTAGKPKKLSHEEACSLPVVFITVYQALLKAELKPNERILVQTAAGGCGLMALQLARLMGAEVYGTSSKADKLDFLREIGLGNLGNYKSTHDFEEEMRTLTRGKGFDVVLNMLSGEMIQKGLNLLSSGGRYIELAVHALKTSPKLDLSKLVENQEIKSIDLRKILLSSSNNMPTMREMMSYLEGLIEEGKIRPIVSKIYPLDRINEAMTYVESGQHIGKVVISHSHTDIQDLSGTLKTQLQSQGKLAQQVRIRLGEKQPKPQVPITSSASWSEKEPQARPTEMDIAIVGVSCRMPGAENKADFWENLKAGRNSVVEVGEDKWPLDSYYDEDPKAEGKSYSKWMGMLKDIDKFDPLFFNISPSEAEMMDPQQRLFLEECWKAIEDAGYAAERLSDQNCGVFVGVAHGDYERDVPGQTDNLEAHNLTGNSNAILSARISYLLNLRGPCMSIDTACSSSLVAIAQACDSLLLGNSDIALAGGVGLLPTPKLHIMTSKAGMLSSDGQCHTFDTTANGFVPAEAVGVLVLKKLAQAKKDKDRIYGVVKGWGINQDGATNGITAPSKDSQVALLTKVYDRFDIDPQTITYIEAHGTGTKLGDPIEIKALKESFQRYTDRTAYCGIGSVKTNIGHALTAAGISGVIKMLLSLQHRQIPPSLNFSRLNEHIDLENSPFYINTELKAWDSPTHQPRRTAISSFGFSGTNAHLVLEEYPKEKPMAKPTGLPVVITLSAKNKERLKEQAVNLEKHLVAHPQDSLYDIAYTLQVGRQAMEERLAIVTESHGMLRSQLADYQQGNYTKAYTGNSLKGNDSNQILLEGNAGKAYLESALRNNELESLARFWVSGAEIDWTLLYTEAEPSKLELPTYPFARERYWWSEGDLTLNATTSGKLHPLLHRNESNLASQNFKSTFTGKENFLSHHKVGEEMVLPGVAYIELARAAGELSTAQKVTQIKEIQWLDPIRVTDAPVQVCISIHPDGEENTYEVYSFESETAPKVLNGKGKIATAALPRPENRDMEAIKKRLGQAKEGKSCYELFSTIGLNLGAVFRGIQKIHYSEEEVLSEIALPLEEGYQLLPGILDSALQSIVGLNFAADEPRIQLPYSIEEVNIYGVLPAKVWSYVRRVKGANGKEKTGHYNVDILDEKGQILLTFRDFFTLPLMSGALPLSAVQASEEPRTGIYDYTWQEAPLSTVSENGTGTDLVSIVLAGSTASVAEGLRRALSLEVSHVTPDTGHLAYFDGLFDRLGADIKNNKASHTLVLCSTATLSDHGFVSGLFKSAHRENPKVSGKVLCVDEELMQDSTALASLIAQELSTGDTEVKYTGQARYIKDLSPIAPLVAGEGPLRIEEGGLYLITGGSGGLGSLFAAHIGNTKKAKPILIGRRPLNKDIEQVLQAVPNAVYHSCDIGDKTAVAQLMKDIQSRYGHLKGIIHSAGHVADDFMVNKIKEVRHTVLAPKIQGTLNLDECSKDMALDFVVYFSSVAAIMGNAGQTDYAAANTFMDHHAQYRNTLRHRGLRQGLTMSINWPLWAEGGMQVAEDVAEYMKKQWGLMPLPKEEGLRVFDELLDQGKEQAAVFYGLVDKFAEKWKAQQQKERKHGTVPASTSSVQHLQEPTEHQLVAFMSELLKIDPQLIDRQKELGSYGFDSILLSKYTNTLNDHFDIDVQPTVFFSYPTVEKLAQYLLEEYPQQLEKVMGDQAEQQVPATIPTTLPTPEALPPTGPSFRKPPRFRSESLSHSPQEQVGTVPRKEEEAIAIVGLSGRYPDSPDLEAFWQNLHDNKDLISEVPQERWDWKKYYGDPLKEKGKTKAKWGGFMPDVDKFDPFYFNILPSEAELMDPQQRLILETVFSAVEDAGITQEKIKGSNTGIFIGVASSDYAMRYGDENNANIEAQFSTGSSHSVLVNRISYLLDLHGPSEPIDTACSSSLVALHRAVENIRSGYCDMAIAGGVNVLLLPQITISFSQAGMLSDDGRCKSFDESANGYVRSEGVGALVLKPLRQAELDGDPIYGIVRGTGENHGGRANTLTSPNPMAQKELLVKAYRSAGVDPGDISYIEAHGTGTPLGDPIEVEGLKAAFKELYRDKGQAMPQEPHCAIGTVKANIGHLEAAAGMAGITKVLLAMKHNTLPGNPHLKNPNKYLKLAGSPFALQQETRTWSKTGDVPKIAGVSSFGFGGSNAHIIIEEYIAPEKAGYSDDAAALILLSAKTPEALKDRVRDLQAHVASNPREALHEIAYTLQVGRDHHEERLAFIAEDREILKKQLSDYLHGEHRDQFRAKVRKKTVPAIDTATVTASLKEQNLSALAEHWVAGAQIDWSQLYPERTLSKLSLPTYPFARERYWIETEAIADSPQGKPAELHPLLHRNESDLKAQKYESTYTGKENFLAHHLVQDRKVLPGVAYLEMAREAGVRSTGQQINQLKEVVWLSPIEVNGTPRNVGISVHPQQEGLTYEVYSAMGDENKVHSQGILLNKDGKRTRSYDLAQLRDKLPQSKEKEEFYALFREIGLNYGSSFQGVEHLFYGEGEVLSKIALKKEPGYVLTPGILDSALQTCAGLNFGNEEKALVLPYSVQEVNLYAELPESLWCYARRNKDKDAGAVIHYDIDILNDAGEVLIDFVDFVGLKFSGDAPKNAEKKTHTYDYPWKESPVDTEKQSTSPLATQVYLIGGTGIMADKLKEVLEIEVEALPVSDSLDYAVQVADRLRTDMKNNGPSHNLVVMSASDAVHFGFLSGLFKSVAQETPKVSGKVLLLEDGILHDVESLGALLNVERIIDTTEVRYQNGTREVRELIPVEAVPEEGLSDSCIKEGGTYLITGGGGGLGRIFARYIASVKDTRILLVGRSSISTELQAFLGEFPRTSYHSCDMGDREALKGLINKVKSEYGGLQGIIHAAGRTEDGLLLHKTSEEIRSVLAPKMLGTKYLDELTKDMTLDFMVYFSSVAAIMGNAGQADYAMANTYLDNYAHYRNALKAAGKRKGHTISINWPLWEEGGIQVNAEVQKYMEQQWGMSPMPTTDGLSVFEKLMTTDKEQAIVTYGKKLKAMKKTVKVKEKQAPSALSDKEQEKLKAFSIRYIKGILHKDLKLPEDRIDLEVPFEDYGIDSLSITKLTNSLGQVFDNLPRTLFFEHQNLGELLEYFMEEHTDTLLKLAGMSPGDNPATVMTEDTPVTPIAVLPDSRPRFIRAVEETNTVHKPLGQTANGAEDIAIIGLGGQYPGAKDVNAFWENLKQGRDSITEIPEERWDLSGFYDAQKGQAGKSFSKWGGFIDGYDRFDPKFFKISPKEAEMMDPQERLFLQTVHEAIEDAGYTKETLRGSKTKEKNVLRSKVGVYVGVMYEEYQLFGVEETLKGRPTALWSSPSSIANRASYFFDFHGPSLAVDTMCSSSLTAIEIACGSLRSGSIDYAVAGGVNVSIHPNKYLVLSQGNFVSSKGRCESFGEGAEGYVPAEGVGAVLLKPLSKAIKDGDHIYGTIKGIAVNHGGKTNGYTVPNPKAQSAVIQEAVRNANIDTAEISYIEAHGTGTSLGDPIEIAGLSKVFAPENGQDKKIKIGSVKSNIGHGESMAAISGITKVLLQLKHRTLVPSLHSETLNPNIDFENSPFSVQQQLEPWTRDGEGPLLAGVSSFGAGGSNGHIIIEEYREQRKAPVHASGPVVLVLSAKNTDRLRAQAENLLQHLQTRPALDLQSMAYTLQVGRQALEERMALVADSAKDIIDRLSAYLEGKSEGIFLGNTKKKESGFLLTGQAGQAYVTTAIKNNELPSLAQLWVKGMDMDWLLLYGEEKPLKMSLPTYPFAPERYWYNAYEQNRQKKVDTVGTLNPVLVRKDNLEPKRVLEAAGAAEADVFQAHEVPSLKIALEDPNDSTVDYSASRAASTILEERPQIKEDRQPTPQEDRTAGAPAISLQSIKEKIKDIFDNILHIPSDEFDEEASFVDVGLDSISGIEILKAVNDTYGTSIQGAALYENPTLDEFAKMILKEAAALPAIETTTRAEVTDVEQKEPAVVLEEPEPIAVSHSDSKQSLVEISAVEVAGSEEDVLTKDIAIIGAEGLFPGADNPGELWSNSLSGESRPNASKGWMGINEGVVDKDLQQLLDKPIEGDITSDLRQHKLVFGVLAKVLASSGMGRKELYGSNTGVFIGLTQHFDNQSMENSRSMASMLASKISYEFNLSGPSEIVNSACTSSFQAIHKAVQAIHNGECTQAIVGSVNVITKETATYKGMEDLVGLLSKEGEMKSFGQEADGIVRSEGIGMVMLKRLDLAESEGNTIQALVKGSSYLHGGKNISWEAPNPKGIKSAVRKSLENAKIDPNTIDYIEAHGIANRISDAIELGAIDAVYKELSSEKDKKWRISSIKPTVGHSGIASGMASLIKVIMALRSKTIPGIPGLGEVNSDLSPSLSLVLEDNAIPWKNGSYPRRAALNSFAVGGTNAHIILEEYKGKGTAALPLPEEEGGKVQVPEKEPEERTPLETIPSKEKEKIDTVFKDITGKELADISMDLPLSELDLTSLQVLDLMSGLNEALDLHLTMGQVLVQQDLGALLSLIEQDLKAPKENYHKDIIYFKNDGNRETGHTYILPGMPGIVDGYYELAEKFSASGNVFGLQMKGVREEGEALTTLAAMAAHNLDLIKELAPTGPVQIVAHSYGGLVLHEMLKQLKDIPDLIIGNVILIDSYSNTLNLKVNDRITAFIRTIVDQSDETLVLDIDKMTKKIMRTAKSKRVAVIHDLLDKAGVRLDRNKLHKMWEVYHASLDTDHELSGLFDVSATLIRAQGEFLKGASEDLGWKAHYSNLRVINAEGDHFSVTKEPHCSAWFAQLNETENHKNQ